MYVEFDDLGQVFLYVERAKAEKAFSDFFSKTTIIKQVKDSCYAIFKEQGLFADELAKLSKRYESKAAVANKCNFPAIRKATLDLVNR